MAGYWQEQLRSRLVRRRFLGGAAGGASALLLAACGSSTNNNKPSSTNTANAASSTSANASPNAAATRAAGSAQPAAVASPQAKRGGTLVYHGVSITQPMNPATVAALASPMWNLIGDPPLRLNDKTYEVGEALIQKWETPAPDSVVLHLRPGVTWHDIAPVSGRAVTSEDIANAINFHAGKLKLTGYESQQFQRASNFTGMDTATATDASTVTLKMSSPSSAIFYGLSDYRVRMIPKEQIDIGFDDSNKLIGSGPFMLTPGFANPREYGGPFSVTANPKYWEAGLPLVDRIDSKNITDPAAQNSALLAGQIDVLSLVNRPAVDIQALAAQKKSLQLVDWPYGYWHWLLFNVGKKPWNDQRVRKAIFLALDYKAMGDGFYGNLWTYSGPLAPAYVQEAIPSSAIQKLPGWNPATKKDDIANAKKMLTAAGYPDGKGLSTTSLIYSHGPHFANATRVKSQLQQVFPQMTNELNVQDDSAAFFAQTAQLTFDFNFYGIFTPPDPTLDLVASYSTGGGRNYAKYSNPDLDKVLSSALAELNADPRKKLLMQAQQTLIDDMPYIPLYTANLAAIFQPGVQGFTGPNRPGPGGSSYAMWDYARYMSKSS
jgi:peptide/nickel transport system substrate-binding protein